MNDLPTLHRVGWNHADVCHQPPRSLPCKPPKDIQLTLSLVVQVGYALNSEDIKSKVYTPMDVDDPTLYNPVNADEPRVYTPMDVDETWVTAWNSSYQDTYCDSLDGSPHAANTSDANCASTYPGMFVRFDCGPGFTDEKPLVDLQSELPPPFKFWTASSTAGVGELGLGDPCGPETNVQEEVGNHETQQTAIVPLPVPTYSLADIQIG
ncbi:hypothetical protein B0H10DRAFT_1964931 [Mycena sp. CBHHK59/15]|nr:hypothetical protein B0H10DRAFT_1968453 [Mycena sp. CBHHK59/15]KAJ6569916.1 hypothetical protein B0H10DRAFT_1964931 [Mycena sp. CBHHK59/15]